MASTISELFAVQHRRDPGRVLVTQGLSVLSVGQLALSISDLRGRLFGERRSPPSAMVAIAARSFAVTFSALHACLSVGASAALLDPDWSSPERESALVRIGATHLVTEDASHGLSIELREGVPGQPSGASGSSCGGDVVFFTSGTTGVPSAIVHNDETICAALWLLLCGNDLASWDGLDMDVGRLLTEWVTTASDADLESGPVLASCFPPWSHAGFTMMNYATLSGAELVSVWPFEPRQALETVAATRASSIGLSPFMAQRLLRAQRHLRCDVDSLVVVGLGSSPVTPGLAEAIEATFNCYVSIGYGLTETGGALARSRWTDPDDQRRRSVGRPLPGVRVQLIGPAGADDIPAELAVKTPALMVARIDDHGSRIPRRALGVVSNGRSRKHRYYRRNNHRRKNVQRHYSGRPEH